ncbi:MAG: DUF362 domain-containing protein [Desulfobulbaceae bacterium]|uniref:DUF362 domain-containing protein n=1 Tax=Candidatus Desulfobia pelagia TaxID=2841692 RepID=A0A8J6NCT6_9BACT|nr:DUF362 domain-containing protein [Candidatus Desulfobia pelagia]
MNISSSRVGILRCANYDRKSIRECINRFVDSFPFTVSRGTKVLIKPNLVAARGHDGLACTHPECVAAVAEWCLGQGARVCIGDSPAFGSGVDVMKRVGIADAVASLDVKLVSFTPGEKMCLAGGASVVVAAEVMESDVLINLPKVKAHSQVRMTLGVKNYFGIVSGWRKAYLHQTVGGSETRFAEMIVDLLAIVPPGMTIIDGISAMHKSGPLDGAAYPLGILAGSLNPVALDTALLDVVQLESDRSLLWQECYRRNLAGSILDQLEYPFLCPEEVRAADFSIPAVLSPIRFNGTQVLRSIRKRIQTVFRALQ